MKRTNPTLDEKLRYHRMRKDGLCDSWEAYVQLKQGLDTTTVKPIENISIDDYEPKFTPQEDLGF